jgi:membrane-bound lytic murein transglycosylase A
VSRRRHFAVVLSFSLGAIVLLGAASWWFFHPAPGPLRLAKASFSDLPGWSRSDPRAALSAFQRSCAVLATKPDSGSMGGYAGTVGDWKAPCAAAKAVAPKNARAFFEQWFAPVAVTAGRVKDGRFTGYYEPEIFVSRSKHGAFQTPVYGRPDDLVTVDLGAFRPSLAGERIAGRVENGKLVPYAARAEIASKGLNHARVLFYANDPIELFFLHIQGSGRVTFDDGSHARVSYAAQNGQIYTAIGKTLIARGVPRDGMSLQVIRTWLKSHPAEALDVMNTDASYIFFA